jgi:hypothetical protein
MNLTLIHAERCTRHETSYRQHVAGRSTPCGTFLALGIDARRRRITLGVMPDVIEPATKRPVPERLKPFAFTAESAALAGKLSGEARRRRKRPKPLPPPDTPPSSQDERLGLIAEQIARTRDALNGNRLQPHHRAALLRALCDLLDQQRIARGEPLPGSLKPSARRPQAGGTAPAVILDQVQPPVVPLKPCAESGVRGPATESKPESYPSLEGGNSTDKPAEPAPLVPRDPQ